MFNINDIPRPLLVCIIIIGGLIGLWGIYAIIITCPLPFDRGAIVGKHIEPYSETEEQTKEDIKKTIKTWDEKQKKYVEEEVHDYYIYRLWLNKDYDDYIIIIQNKRLADYLFWKSVIQYTTNYYVHKSTYDIKSIDQQFDIRTDGGSIFDENNSRILMREWNDRSIW